MEKKEVIVVGQGLSGTWLSWWLYQSGISFKVVDQLNPNSASMRAAGLINPVTGRRLVTTWMIDELMPFALDAYGRFGEMMEEKFIEESTVIDFFPSVQMLQAFQKRYEEDRSYLHAGADPEKYKPWFDYDFGWAAIRPCYLVMVDNLLTSWRGWLKNNGLILESEFDQHQVEMHPDEIEYSGIRSRYMIFCDGKSASENIWFKNLPFALNKGEGLLVEIRGLPANLIFKKGMGLVPYGENIFWLGSSYEWAFSDDQPSDLFRKNAENWLKHFLKMPFTILEHFASLRPATLERRPFVGFHPVYPQIGILNGMGTKGCSLAPYFGRQLVSQLKGTGNIHPLADIDRFARILGRN